MRFEKTIYEVTEGQDGSVEVCAIIYNPDDVPCPVDFNFEIILNDGLSKSIAKSIITMMISILFLISDDLPITFSVCSPNNPSSNRSCADVTIEDDDKLEGDTTITMRLRRTTDFDSRIIVNTGTSTIRITDDPNDSMFILMRYVASTNMN